MCVNVNAISLLNTWQCILCNVLGLSYSSAIANGCTQCQHHLSLGNCKRANCRRFLLSRFARGGSIRQQQQKNVVTIKLFSNSGISVRCGQDPIFYIVQYNPAARGEGHLHYILYDIWWLYDQLDMRKKLSDDITLLRSICCGHSCQKISAWRQKVGILSIADSNI